MTEFYISSMVTKVNPIQDNYSLDSILNGDGLRYQPMTDQEAYDSFKDACQIKVNDAMKIQCQERIEEVVQWPESEDKRRRIQYLTSDKPSKFPGKKNIYHPRI